MRSRCPGTGARSSCASSRTEHGRERGAGHHHRHLRACPVRADVRQNERFGRYLRAGRVQRRDRAHAAASPTDPWALLAVDVTTDARRIAATHYDWAVKLFEEPLRPGQQPARLHRDGRTRYDFAASSVPRRFRRVRRLLGARLRVRRSPPTSWRGAAPPSAKQRRDALGGARGRRLRPRAHGAA